MMYGYIMHRTQVLLEEQQYRRLKEESARTGRSIGELVREAIDLEYGDHSRDALLEALDDSYGAWADRPIDGAEYVETIREGLGDRLRELGWD